MATDAFEFHMPRFECSHWQIYGLNKITERVNFKRKYVTIKENNI